MKASRNERANIKAKNIVKKMNFRQIEVSTLSQSFTCAKCGKKIYYGKKLIAWDNGYGIVTNCASCFDAAKTLAYHLSKTMAMSEIKHINVHSILKGLGGKKNGK